MRVGLEAIEEGKCTFDDVVGEGEAKEGATRGAMLIGPPGLGSVSGEGGAKRAGDDVEANGGAMLPDLGEMRAGGLKIGVVWEAESGTRGPGGVPMVEKDPLEAESWSGAGAVANDPPLVRGDSRKEPLLWSESGEEPLEPNE